MIDGNINTVVAVITLGTQLAGLAVNPFTNRIYVDSPQVNQVDIVNGNTPGNRVSLPLAAIPANLQLT